jgi:hypothetical protein
MALGRDGGSANSCASRDKTRIRERGGQDAPMDELPLPSAPKGPVDPAPNPLADPRALTILTTEHWSLLSARGLVYNEAFARSGMFLTFVSGTFVALGLASTATGFSDEFLAVAAVALGLDLFIGVATLGRLMAASREDIRSLQGMNRIRHAYHDMVPGLERYFITSRHDDARGVIGGYGQSSLRSVGGVAHGFTTTMGMLGVIDASIAAVLVGVLALLLDATASAAFGLGVVTLGGGIAGQLALMARGIARTARSLHAEFPTPGAEPGIIGGGPKEDSPS